MIQELLNGSGLIPGETKFSTSSSHHLHHHHHHNNPPPGVFSPLITTTSSHTSLPPIPPPSSTATTTTTSAATSANSDNHQNLRCPRCDSSNTKFCYYNNYNLTQPRHFCKTCRRYWTKGGALRNVPIGGGCRKNRSVGGSAVKTSVAKIKTAASPSEMLGAGAGFREHDPNNPILWGSPQSSHVLALLRAGQSPNPNPNPSLPISMNKEEGKNLMVSHNTTVTEPMVGSVLVHGRALNFDSSSLGNDQFPTLGLCSSIWRSSSDINGNSNNQDGFLVGEVVHEGNSGIQELYQRLRSSSSSANYCNDINNSSAQVLRNMASSSTTSSLSANLGSASVVSHGDDQLGYTSWNPTPSWFDLSATNGTLYP